MICQVKLNLFVFADQQTERKTFTSPAGTGDYPEAGRRQDICRNRKTKGTRKYSCTAGIRQRMGKQVTGTYGEVRQRKQKEKG